MGRRIAATTFLATILFAGNFRSIDSFVTPQSSQSRLTATTRLNARKVSNVVNSGILASSVMIGAALWNPLPAQAYVPSDYASDTVQETLQALKNAQGDVDATFKVYENIAGIITEGKGVGGMVNYSK